MMPRVTVSITINAESLTAAQTMLQVLTRAIQSGEYLERVRDTPSGHEFTPGRFVSVVELPEDEAIVNQGNGPMEKRKS